MATIQKIETTSAVAGAEEDAFSGILIGLSCVHTELLLFAVAIFAYFALFMQRTPKNSKLQAKKLKVVEEEVPEEDQLLNAFTKSSTVEGEEHSGLVKSLRSSFDNADYRSVLRCWDIVKKFDRMPAVSLPQVVESMQRLKKDTPFILRELKAFFKKFPSECDMTCINELLESLAKRLDSDLMEKIAVMLPSIGLSMDERSYEIFLNMYFTTRSFQELTTLVSQMEAKLIPFTTRSSMVVVKAALKTNCFDDAVKHFRDCKKSWSADCLFATPSVAPSHIISQLVDLACKDHKLSQLVPELRGVPISLDNIGSMLSECARQKDSPLANSVENLATERGVQFTDATYALLIKASMADPVRVQALFDEVVEKHIEVTADFVGSVLAFCTQTSNVELAAQLYEYVKPEQLPVLSDFIRFYATCGQYVKACDVYEHDLLRLHSSSGPSPHPQGHRTFPVDARMERSLMNAALKCGRADLAKSLLNASPSDIAKHITMIRNLAAENKLDEAVDVFTMLESSGVDMNSIIYNTVLDACVECKDLRAAEAWMEQTKQAGMADVVSFNTLIKAHLQNGNFAKARCLVNEMKKDGHLPSCVTFNELINAMVSKGHVQRKQMWDLVEEMKAADVKPNHVTISILLKSLNFHSSQSDIMTTMDLCDAMEEPMDEVLLSSVVEACVRIGKPDLLEARLKKLQSNTAVAINGSHAYGSIIKAYGHAKDVKGVWRCWKEMRTRHIKPSCITLGCTVEAIVSNGDTEGAYDLIHQMQDDENCRTILNSVIYCSVLKGFTRERKMDRVFAVYEEMIKNGIEVSIVTYNTLIDACARSGRMDYLPKVMEDMKTAGVKPNLITWSTTLKGHCQNSDVPSGFLILEQVQKDTEFKPDEIMYNSLLDGCAQNILVNEGLRLLDQMQAEGVKPTNYTLSVVVKLMNRARRLDQAFSIVEDITKKYHFQPNVHVYANLVHACVSNQQLKRGMGILEQMVRERVSPDSRTYAILMRGNISRGFFSDAAGLLKGALGLTDALPFLQQPIAVCSNLDNSVVNEVLVSIAERGHSQDVAAPLLSSITKNAPQVRIDAVTQRKVLFPHAASDGGAPRPSKGKGKGKGSWGRQ